MTDSAREVAAEAGFGPVPESVTVSYDVTTDPQTAFDLGVAEGRRQATEAPGGPDAAEVYAKLLAELVAVTMPQWRRDAQGRPAEAVAAAHRAQVALFTDQMREIGRYEGRCQQAAKVEELQVLLDQAEQYARDLQDNGDVPERTDEKIDRIREWLRMHGDYDVKLSLWAPYGTIQVKLTHLNGTVWSDFGTTYGKRLDWALAQIEKIGEASHG